MFRHFFHIVIALLICIFTSGIVVSKHFCSGKLVSVSFNKSSDHCCSDSCDCCDDENLFLRIDDEFYLEEFQFESYSFSIELYAEVSDYAYSWDIFQAMESRYYPDPPPDSISVVLSKNQLYLC